MSSLLNPYLAFNGNARQAMEFYQEVFGGELTTSSYGDFGGDAEHADKIMHSQLQTKAGFTLMASDMPPGQDFQPGNNISISLSGDDAALRDYWDRLSGTGVLMVPLEQQPWGDEFGMCADKFGIGWLVNISQPQG